MQCTSRTRQPLLLLPLDPDLLRVCSSHPLRVRDRQCGLAAHGPASQLAGPLEEQLLRQPRRGVQRRAARGGHGRLGVHPPQAAEPLASAFVANLKEGLGVTEPAGVCVVRDQGDKDRSRLGVDLLPVPWHELCFCVRHKDRGLRRRIVCDLKGSPGVHVRGKDRVNHALQLFYVLRQGQVHVRARHVRLQAEQEDAVAHPQRAHVQQVAEDLSVLSLIVEDADEPLAVQHRVPELVPELSRHRALDVEETGVAPDDLGTAVTRQLLIALADPDQRAVGQPGVRQRHARPAVPEGSYRQRLVERVQVPRLVVLRGAQQGLRARSPDGPLRRRHLDAIGILLISSAA
mmetsp:Transcript_108782/g.307572  ORF Transcript_108782/g.307572 Transcript_108782/m.307572 type:complete len:346 (+) Transcript_108782:963-2000(+)